MHLVYYIHAFPLSACSWEHGGLWGVALFCLDCSTDNTTLQARMPLVLDTTPESGITEVNANKE